MGPCGPLACSKAALITVRYASYIPDWKKIEQKVKERDESKYALHLPSVAVGYAECGKTSPAIPHSFSTMAVFD